jgi:RNA polymerase sigma factor (sigma-70 family)
MPDEGLLELCLAPNAAAEYWEELVRRLQKYCRGVVYNVLRRVDATDGVDDVIQDVLDKLLADNCRSLRGLKFRHANSLQAFAITVARRRAIDFVRRHKCSEELPDLPDVRSRPERTILITEIFAYVEKNTTPSENDIFGLYYTLGHSALEIANLLNRELRDVEYVLWRMMLMLRKKFGPGGPPSKKK